MLCTCDDLCVQEALRVFERVKISVCNYGQICYLVSLVKLRDCEKSCVCSAP
jgi:hypothetical protein